MVGYKVFNPDWTCRDFQYEVGETYITNDEIKCCEKGFHFCKDLKECFYYYDFDYNNKFAIVEANGKIISDNNKKFCTNNITIVKELSFSEVCEILGFSEKIASLLVDSFYLTKYYNRFESVFLGGNWIGGIGAGPCKWIMDYGPSGAWRSFGACLINNKVELYDYWVGQNFGYITENGIEIIEDYDGRFTKEEVKDYCDYLRENLFGKNN